jgi:hypothetical protein
VANQALHLNLINLRIWREKRRKIFQLKTCRNHKANSKFRKLFKCNITVERVGGILFGFGEGDASF